jgi:hypothetical protein
MVDSGTDTLAQWLIQAMDDVAQRLIQGTDTVAQWSIQIVQLMHAWITIPKLTPMKHSCHRCTNSNEAFLSSLHKQMLIHVFTAILMQRLGQDPRHLDARLVTYTLTPISIFRYPEGSDT